MRRTIFLILVLISLILLVINVGSQVAARFFGDGERGGIKITSTPGALVYLDDKQVGTTPFSNENLSSGEYQVKVATDSGSWQGHVAVVRGTLTVVNRELAAEVASSSGEILTLTHGKGVVVTSFPDGAAVEIDGKEYGRTPLSVADLASGDHTFLLAKDGYLKRSIRAFQPPDLTLNLNVDLAITEPDLSTITAPAVSVTQQVVVKSTPTGFLRLRDKPSLNGKEITRVDTGVVMTLIEDSGGWSKVRLEDGKEGYVSSQYVEKKTAQ
jgi:hypothetical protein